MPGRISDRARGLVRKMSPCESLFRLCRPWSGSFRPAAWRTVRAVRIFSLLLLVLACSPSADREDDGFGGSGRADAPRDAVPVKVARPVRGEIALALRATTSLTPEEEAEVYARSPGYCREVLVQEGDEVRQGTVLAGLEDQEIRLTLDQTAARLRKAANEYARADQLFSEGLISTQMHQDLALQLGLARADHELARKRLSDTAVASPLAGVVVNRKVKVGDMVSPAQPLFRVVKLDPLRAVVHVPEQDYLRVRPAQESRLTADAFPQRTFSAVVDRVNPVIDSQSGTVEVTIAVKNPEHLLRPGMFVRVQIINEVRRDALLIPREAVLLQGENRVVYVVRDGVARRTEIQAGFQDADRLEVLQGLAAEDLVVVTGHLGLAGDTRVRIVAESNP